MHRLSRRVVRTVAAVTLVGLIVLQGTVAAYACSVSMLPTSAGSAHQGHAASGDCAGMQQQSTDGLCLKHCSQGTDANTTLSAVDVPGMVLTSFVVIEPAARATLEALRTASRPDAHGNSPPPLLLSRRLRI